jgi:hypothetical protein
MGKELTLQNSLRPFGILLIVLVIVVYVQFQARNLLQGPTIVLTSEPGALIHEKTVTIAGNAKNIVELRLNGKVIHTNEIGDFSELVVLPQGYNIVTVTASDRFGRTTSLTREYVQAPMPSGV